MLVDRVLDVSEPKTRSSMHFLSSLASGWLFWHMGTWQYVVQGADNKLPGELGIGQIEQVPHGSTGFKQPVVSQESMNNCVDPGATYLAVIWQGDLTLKDFPYV